MPYTVTKRIIPKQKTFWDKVLPVPILLLAFPVVLIGMLSMLVLLLGEGLLSLFRKKKVGGDEEPYYKELSLVHHDAVSITVSEDERDAELTAWNEVWTSMAYNDETYLYRARTSPVIPGLHNRILGFYSWERPGGVILQVATGSPTQAELSTELVYLQYNNLLVTPLQEIGCAHLYNEAQSPEIIRGFNDKEEMELTVQ